MKIKVSIIGVLDGSLPDGEDSMESDDMTVQDLLNTFVEMHGTRAREALLDDHSGLREGLSLLVNGRNVLSLPDEFQTMLENGDEVVITAQVSGG